MDLKVHSVGFVVLMTICFTNGQEIDLTSVVETDRGPLRGEILITVLESMEYAAFKGIPYAKSPTGTLRFQPPVDIDAWTDVLNATTEGSMCTQYNSTSESVVGSEDCLFLNVFTPHTKFNGSLSKPVLVWIYGGSFTTGNSNASYYGPDFLLEKDVIVVSFNYRLGPLGFLNLNHDNATGNCALKDQNLALKWVQRNIAKFGGNPKNVTIIGQSAGSVSVDLQVLSDMSVGLFQQSISLSGSTLCLYWGFQSSTEAVQQAFRLGSKLGTTTLSKDTLLQSLLNATAADIITAANELGLIPFRPSIESTSVAKDQEKFLTTCSVSKYLRGNYTKGPHIMGFTSDETLAFGKTITELVDFTKEALTSINNVTSSSNIPLLGSISKLITTGVANLTDAAVYRLIKETSDLFFLTGIDTKQKLMNLHNGYPIYYYRFSFDSNYSAHRTSGINFKGVGHEDDLPYIFYRPSTSVPLNQSDIATTRDRMVLLYTNFVKYGNPTPNGTDDELLGVTWTESGSSGIHLEINTNLTMESRPIDATVISLQTAGLGASPIYNECSKNIISSIINSFPTFLGLLG